MVGIEPPPLNTIVATGCSANVSRIIRYFLVIWCWWFPAMRVASWLALLKRTDEYVLYSRGSSTSYSQNCLNIEAMLTLTFAEPGHRIGLSGGDSAAWGYLRPWRNTIKHSRAYYKHFVMASTLLTFPFHNRIQSGSNVGNLYINFHTTIAGQFSSICSYVHAL